MQRFIIMQYFASATWNWFIFTDRCAICRNDLNEPSIDYQLEFFKMLNCENSSACLDSQSIGIGKCNHSYHLDCIETWLNDNLICPLCFAEWEYSKILNLY